MSGVVTRWEKERASWLMARSRPGSSARRRAELLGRRARRLGRGGSGVAETSLHEDVTPPLFRRMLKTGDGAGEQLARLAFVPLLYAVAGLLVGPAVAIAAGLYRVVWQRAPRIGRLRVWPWLASGSVVGLVGAVVWHLSGAGPGMWWVMWPPALHVYPPVAVPTWLWGQVTIALLLTGWTVRAQGWAAVPRGAVPKPEKDKNGEFIKTAEKDKVRLDPLAGETAAPRHKETSSEPMKKFSLSAEIAQPDQAKPAPDHDESPVFADEDAELHDEPVFEGEIENKTA